MKRNTSHVRALPETKRRISELSLDFSAREKKRVSTQEILRRTFNIPNLKDVLTKDSEAKKKIFNRRGQLFSQIGTVFLIITVLAIIGCVFFIVTLLLPPLLSSADTITTGLVSQTASNEFLNNATNKTFVPVNQGIQNLRFVGYFILIGPLIALAGMAYFVRLYPVLIIFWIVGMVIVVGLSIALSIAYSGVAASDSSYATNSTNHFLMSNLPIILTIIGLFGMVLLFVVIPRDPEAELGGGGLQI